MRFSVIVSTYNRPRALAAVLEALCYQTVSNFETVIADDGSAEETELTIRSFQKRVPYPLMHAWQSDRGFRAASSRNSAVRQSSGDYLLFLDGDCLPRADWVARHASLAEKGYFVAGNRVLLDAAITKQIEDGVLPVQEFLTNHPLRYRNHLNRVIPLVKLPLGPFRKLNSHAWEKARTCNLAIWRQDFLDVNGFDEAYEGWGFEDSDLAIRLLNLGRKRKLGACATAVLHLYHEEYDRRLAGVNRERLESHIRNKVIRAEKGLF